MSRHMRASALFSAAGQEVQVPSFDFAPFDYAQGRQDRLPLRGIGMTRKIVFSKLREKRGREHNEFSDPLRHVRLARGYCG